MITISTDPRALLGALTEMETLQLPFAVSKGLNALANAVQAAQRDHITKAFHLRRAPFVLKGIKIAKEDRASKTSWRVVIQLAYPDDRHFMDEHETGQERIPHGRYLWQPNQDVFRNRVITAASPLHPRNLARNMKAMRAFIIRTPQGEFVLQRTNAPIPRERGARGRFQMRTNRRRKGKTRVLYRLVDRVAIPARLEFVQTAQRIVQGQAQALIGQHLDAVMGRS